MPQWERCYTSFENFAGVKPLLPCDHLTRDCSEGRLENTVNNLDKPMKRRRFLARSLQGLVLGASSLSALEAAARDLQLQLASEEMGISAGQWEALAAVLDHLLPSEPATKDQPFRPGARDVQAMGYLKLVLRDPKLDPEDTRLLQEGVTALEERCLKRFQRRFPDLSSSEQETLLRDFEKTLLGERWLGEMLDFLLEALLGDPSRGGNPDGMGWKWLGITPGFPLPPRNSRDSLK